MPRILLLNKIIIDCFLALIITESERKEIDSLIEESKQRGRISTEQLISRLEAIPLEDFMNNINKEYRNMKKKNITVNIDELVKQRPVLTEEEMNEFCTYEEIVADAKRLFDEMVAEIIERSEKNGKDREHL